MKKHAALISVTVVAALALTGCSPSAEPEAVAEGPGPVAAETATPEPAETPGPTPTPTQLSAADCKDGPTAIIRLPADAYAPSYSNTARLDGEIFDTGPRDLAAGDPTLNEEGEIVSYTVQPGETLAAIAGRFCVGERTLAAYNHTNGHDLQAGAAVVLRPDPEEPWSRD